MARGDGHPVGPGPDRAADSLLRPVPGGVGIVHHSGSVLSRDNLRSGFERADRPGESGQGDQGEW